MTSSLLLSTLTILGAIYHNQSSSYYLRKFLVLLHFSCLSYPREKRISLFRFGLPLYIHDVAVLCPLLVSIYSHISAFVHRTQYPRTEKHFSCFSNNILSFFLSPFSFLSTSNVQLAIRLFSSILREYGYTEYSGVIIYRKQTNVLPSIHFSLSLFLFLFPLFGEIVARKKQRIFA